MSTSDAPFRRNVLARSYRETLREILLDNRVFWLHSLRYPSLGIEHAIHGLNSGQTAVVLHDGQQWIGGAALRLRGLYVNSQTRRPPVQRVRKPSGEIIWQFRASVQCDICSCSVTT